MVRQDPDLQKKAKPGEIAIRGDIQPDELKHGDVEPIDRALGEKAAIHGLGRLPDPETKGVFTDKPDGEAD